MTMGTIKATIVTAITIFTISSCNNRINKINTGFEDHHTAQNSLDWQGTYSGILPCADCSGIETNLTLNEDQTFVMTDVYLGKNDSETIKSTGKFEWNGNFINLLGIKEGERPTTYKVEENRIRIMDLKGKEIKGDMAQNYVLKKNGNPTVEDQRWQLIELNGKAVQGKPETHYIVFHSKEGRIEAKANCNIMSWSYTIKNELQLKTEKGISTLMACPDNLEDELSGAISKADNLSTDGENLSLNKARMAPLARFKRLE
jgi:copper homeostasis protein (lipoprotein)